MKAAPTGKVGAVPFYTPTHDPAGLTTISGQAFRTWEKKRFSIRHNQLIYNKMFVGM
jgi:hypothetical protein